MANKYISIRIDEFLLNKLHIVAQHELRSANSEIIFLIREAVEKFEEKTRKNRFSKMSHGSELPTRVFCVILQSNFSLFIR